MKLTLYRSCIVNNNYDEVFATRELIDEYLLKLSHIEFTIDGVYPQYSGTLQFEYNSQFFPVNYVTETITDIKRDIMSTNYCVIEDEELLSTGKVYAFINSIDITNDICFLNYTTDLWHTYLGFWDFRQGLLTKSLRTYLYNGLKEKNYPCTIFTNTSPKLVNINGKEDEMQDCWILATLQLYTLKSGTDTKINRITQSYFIGSTRTRNNIDLDNVYFNLKNGYYENDTYMQYDDIVTLQGVISALIAGQASEQNVTVKNGGTSSVEKMYYDITNVYLIPRDTISDIFSNVITLSKEGNYLISINTGDKLNSRVLGYPYPIGDNIILYNKAIDYSPLNYGVGFYTKMININNNGMPISVIVNMLTRDDKIYFYLETCGQIIDITECFSYDLPWQGVTAETLAQRKISTTLENSAITNAYAKTGLEIAGNAINTFISGVGAGIATKPTDILSNVKSGINSALNIGKGIADIVYLADKEEAVNAEKYSNSKANQTVAQSVINLLYGLCVYSYGTLTNFTECEQKLLEIGYDVNHLITSFPTSDTQENSKYEIMKFGFVRLNGLPTDINDAIKQIMFNGFKLWFNSNV